MDMSKTLDDKWQDIESLEFETKKLLETIREKPKGKSVKAAEAKESDKKTSSKKFGKKRRNPANTTEDILDVVSPDATPRTKERKARLKYLEDEKEKLKKLEETEKSFRKLRFTDEKSRVASAADTFVPRPDITETDIIRERQRLMNLEESARLKTQKLYDETNQQKNYLQQDRMALKLQKTFRGFVGRQKFSLSKKLQSIHDATLFGDWVEVEDPNSGEVWYYNKTTGKSQWTKPKHVSTMKTLEQTENAKTQELDPFSTIKLPQISNMGTTELNQTLTPARKTKIYTDKNLAVSKSLPSLEAMKMADTIHANDQLQPLPLKKQLSFKDDPEVREYQAKQEVIKMLELDTLIPNSGLTAPDGSFKPQLRKVVLDALLDTRFDSVSTVLADPRWYENNEDQIKSKNKQTKSIANLESRTDPTRIPLITPITFNKKKDKRGKAIEVSDPHKVNKKKLIDQSPVEEAKELTLNDLGHEGLVAKGSSVSQPLGTRDVMCFGCWSAGAERCTLHTSNAPVKASQTMLLCRNWELDIMRRRYRSEEIQEIFMKKDASLRYDTKHKKFSTVIEQRHPIYRAQSQLLDIFNDRMVLFEKIKKWMLSLPEEFQTNKKAISEKGEAFSNFMKLKRSLLNNVRVSIFSKTNAPRLPIAPITGYSWAERKQEETYLFKQIDHATGEEVDLINITPHPKPKFLYLPREYHISVPKSIPMPQPTKKDSGASAMDAGQILTATKYINDLHAAAWMERMAASITRDAVHAAEVQIRAVTPMQGVEMVQRTKNPTPCTIKFATIGQKPTPGNLAVGGLALELLINQLISTFLPSQYGSLLVMDKSVVSPGVSPEVTISFESLVMAPVVQPHLLRPLEHPLNYRRAPTITLNSSVEADNLTYYGINRPEQTGEQEAHGFRTTAWAPMLLTYAETDPQVFVPGQEVVSLNVPKANVSQTTHADHTYPFCEPSTRDNSTLDFYHLLLAGVVSMAKAQVFTALTVQEPGQFMKAYRQDLPMGQLLVSVYRSWGFTQKDTIQEFKTDDGISYWYHRKTGQTFWERPLYEDEEKSPLDGGTLLGQAHEEEPSTMSHAGEGATRRYSQGEFRHHMLSHVETPNEAIARRRAAAATVKNARQRGIVPEIPGIASIANHAADSVDPGSRFDFSRSNNPSMNQNVDTLADSEMVTHIGPGQDPSYLIQGPGESHQLQPYSNSHVMDGRQQESSHAYPQEESGYPNQYPTDSYAAGLVPAGRLDDGSYLPSRVQTAESYSANLPHSPQSANVGHQRHQAVTSVPAMGAVPNLPGMNMDFIANLSDMLGKMMHNTMLMDHSNPQSMIQLGLGMGMALMQTGAAQGVVDQQVDRSRSLYMGEPVDSYSEEEAEEHFGTVGDMGVIPVLSEEESTQAESLLSGSIQNSHSQPSRVSGKQPTGMIGSSQGEPIGLPHPTAVYSSDKVVDHSEEMQQRAESEQNLENPMKAIDQAKHLQMTKKPTITPDEAPLKQLTLERPRNADEGVFESQTAPVLAYPELSTMLPDGAPLSYKIYPPAGLGTSFVSKSEEFSQQMVKESQSLRKTVMPLPVGFFEAIEAKHVAKQNVDYLPQVPNLPQSRTIGRVKPRSAAADWLMISFDPWSAGKNPLGTEFVPSLMEKAEKLMDLGAAKAADEIDTLRRTTVSGAFVTVEDEEGLARQRAEISKAEHLSADFKKLCSLCRHSKFQDAEQLINQPDWCVPIDYQDDQGNTLLHIVAQNGNKRLIKLCLRRGAQLNVQNLTGQTALHFAFGYGFVEVGEYLVGKGADDSIKNKDGLTCYEGLAGDDLQLL